MKAQNSEGTCFPKASSAQVAKWKEEFNTNNIWHFQTPDQTHRCYIRRPTRKDLSIAAVAGAQDPLKFNESILKSCWIDGNIEIQEQDELFMGINSQLAAVIETAQFSVEKL